MAQVSDSVFAEEVKESRVAEPRDRVCAVAVVVAPRRSAGLKLRASPGMGKSAFRSSVNHRRDRGSAQVERSLSRYPIWTRPRERLRTRLPGLTTGMKRPLHGAYDGRTVASRVPANGSRLQSIAVRPRLIDVDDFSAVKCASDCPALVACLSHWGISPLPSQVSPKALRYRADF